MRNLWLLLLAGLLAACGSVVDVGETPTPGLGSSADTPAIAQETPTRTEVVPQMGTPTTLPRPAPEDWQEWSVVPEVFSAHLRAIYTRGLALGNDPQAYSKIGDCDASPTLFLGVFDGDPDGYSLGEYAYLQEIIDYFHGSHSRISLASGNGFSSANVLTAFMADPKVCDSGETPLDCELRIHKPSFAIISLGSNDIYHQDAFDTNMRQILDRLIEQGIVPILVSKADNLEGDHAINLEIARLAYEYNLPFWNFWLAVQDLPQHGLLEDGAHLTWAGPYFDDPVRMQNAWPWRNLTALQTLDALWRWVTAVP
jgi:hypothetical protein